MGGFGGGSPGGGQQRGGQPQGPTGPQATFPGGNMQLQQFIRNNTNYPQNLQDNKITGRVTVSYTIDTDGSIINPVITNNAEVFIMDKEALRTIMIMPDWIPAEQDGKPVQAQHTSPVSFGSGGMGGMGGMGGFGF
jgi:TonB family protein